MKRLSAVATLAVASVTLSGCGWECVYDTNSTMRSPDGRYDAVIYDKSCGAMVGAREGISLVEAGDSLTARTDIRVLYYDPVADGKRPTVSWSADGALAVQYDARATVITQLAVVARIPVRYKAYDHSGNP